MADYHRLSAPTYFGGLPAGYDYLNDPQDPSVGATGDPAIVDPIKASGPNEGTYFAAFGEDGRTGAVNRGLGAIGLNTDYIDNTLHNSVPKVFFVDATAVGAVSTIALVGQIFVGESGMVNNAENRSLLVHITAQTTFDDLEVGASKIVPTLIHDGAAANVVGTEASGFRTNASVNVSPSIPNGTAYRIWYGVRSSVHEIARTELGTWFKQQMRTAEHIPGVLRGRLRELHSEAAVNQGYLDAWDSTIRSLASAGLNERYRRATTQPVGFVTGDYNVAGGGRIITRDGGAVEVRAPSVDITTAQYPDPQLAGFRAVTGVTAQTLTGFDATRGGDIGFLHESETIKEDSAVEAVRNTISGPGFVDVTPRDIRAATSGANDVITFINPTANGSLNPDSVNDTANRRTIQCAAGQYFRAGGLSALRHDVDLIEVTYSGRAPETYIFDGFLSDTRIQVNRMNGTSNALFPAVATNCTIRFLQVLFFAGGSARSGLTSPNPWTDSKFYVAQPAQLTDNPTAENWPRPPGFYAALDVTGVDDNGFSAMAWGNAAANSGSIPEQLGFLRGDGTIDTTGIRCTGDIEVDDDVIIHDDLVVDSLSNLTDVLVNGVATFAATSATTFVAGGTALFESAFNVTFGSLGNLHVDQPAVIHRIPLHAMYVEQTGSFEDTWTLTRGVAPGVWVQQSVSPSSGAQIFFPLRVEPGDIINDITMLFDGRVGSAGAHAGFTITLPELTLVIGPNGTDLQSVTDPSASLAAYEVQHDVTLSGGIFPYTVLNLDYFLRVNGERGAQAQANTAGIKALSATIVRKSLVSTTFL